MSYILVKKRACLVNMNNMTLTAEEDLGLCVTTVDSRCIREDFVGKDIIIESMNIESWVRCVKTREEVAIW